MRTAILIGDGELAWEDGTVGSRLAEQLRGLGVDRVERGDLVDVAQLARAAPPGDLVIAAADVVTQREALAGVLADPRLGTAVLSSRSERGPRSYPLRSERGRALSAGSELHSVGAPTEWSLGVLKVRADDRPALVETAERLRQLRLDGDPVALLVVGLVRGGVHVGQSDVRELFWARPESPEEVAQAQRDITGHDEERVLLDSSVKAIDGFFTTFFVSPYSKHIARWAARRGLTPNQVTAVSMMLGVLAAAGFATGERWGLVAGAVLLQVAFTADCVDGQLARFTRTFTPLGAWLDSTFDRLKEWVVFAGLAVGASQAGDPVWVMAGAALTLQTVRHGFDFAFAAAEHQTFDADTRRPLDDPSDGTSPAPHARCGPALGYPTRLTDELDGPRRVITPPSRSTPKTRRAGGVLARWRRVDRVPGLIWVKRVIVFPIGERFAAISLTAALWDARVTFAVVLVWGAIGAVYGLAGRVLRSLR